MSSDDLTNAKEEQSNQDNESLITNKGSHKFWNTEEIAATAFCFLQISEVVLEEDNKLD